MAASRAHSTQRVSARSRVRGAIAWQKSEAPRVRIQLAPSRVYIEDLRGDTTAAGTARTDRSGVDDGRVIPDIPLVGEGLRQASIEVALDHLELADANFSRKQVRTQDVGTIALFVSILSDGRSAVAAEEIGEPQLLFPCYDGLATLYLALGDTAKTEEYLAKGQAICQKTGYTADALIMLPFLC
jgi:hypothetical protein